MKKLALALCVLVSGLCVAVEPTVTMAFIGDVMLDDGPGKTIMAGKDPLSEFSDLLDEHDLRIANLECVVGVTGTELVKPWTFQAHPRVIPLIKRHFDAVSVANNHSGDFGRAALLEQFDLFTKAGIPWFGGGRNLREAHRPWIVEKNGIRIAILGYNEFKPRLFEASADYAGVAWSSEDEQVLHDIAVAREDYHADIVLPYMHWGWEYVQTPNERQTKFARKMIDAGATAVIGGHPHVTQGADLYKESLIVYSLGNFVFDGFDTDVQKTGWLLSMKFNKNKILSWKTHVAKLDDEGTPHWKKDWVSPCGDAKEIKDCRGGQ